MPIVCFFDNYEIIYYSNLSDPLMKKHDFHRINVLEYKSIWYQDSNFFDRKKKKKLIKLPIICLLYENFYFNVVKSMFHFHMTLLSSI